MKEDEKSREKREYTTLIAPAWMLEQLQLAERSQEASGYLAELDPSGESEIGVVLYDPGCEGRELAAAEMVEVIGWDAGSSRGLHRRQPGTAWGRNHDNKENSICLKDKGWNEKYTRYVEI